MINLASLEKENRLKVPGEINSCCHIPQKQQEIIICLFEIRKTYLKCLCFNFSCVLKTSLLKL